MKKREEQVKKLYKHTHKDHSNIETMSVSEMEDAISKYYGAADFEVTSIDELLERAKL
ncbi:hypothetical protein [uncultured Clostridium sp.]|uniref:hypothetical protein n=1 Tax=uncultured Clostridium sp. TaxID=59620 RepID=UPI00262D4B2E|nr:hypothetical protein [uncultured Clostridium sp.]